MSFSTSVFVMRAVLRVGLLFVVLGLYLFGHDLWLFWEAHRPTSLGALTDPKFLKTLLDPLKALGWQAVYDLKVIVGGLVFRFIWRRLPIPDRLVRQWAVDDHDLHPIAGRMLVRSLRWSGRLKVQQTLDISDCAQRERYFTHKALNRKGAQALFERFPLADERSDPR